MSETQEEPTLGNLDLDKLAGLLYEEELQDKPESEEVVSAEGVRDDVKALADNVKIGEDKPARHITRSTKEWRRSRVSPKEITLH